MPSSGDADVEDEMRRRSHGRRQQLFSSSSSLPSSVGDGERQRRGILRANEAAAAPSGFYVRVLYNQEVLELKHSRPGEPSKRRFVHNTCPQQAR